MANNRGVVYLGPGKVEVQSIDFPKLALGSRKCVLWRPSVVRPNHVKRDSNQCRSDPVGCCYPLRIQS